MQPVMFGPMTDPAIVRRLEQAKNAPGSFMVYLVEGNSEPRTPAQNRMFRAMLAGLAQTHGNSVQYWYDYLVERFLGFDEVVTEEGYIRKVLRATSTLTVAEFTSFLNACLVFVAETQMS